MTLKISLFYFLLWNLTQYVLFSGLLVGGCGTATVRFRPALIFSDKHLEITLDIITKSLSKL